MGLEKGGILAAVQEPEVAPPPGPAKQKGATSCDLGPFATYVGSISAYVSLQGGG